MSKYLFILNEAAYGNERSFNALRLAGGLATHTAITRPVEFEVRIFLLGDAVTCAKRGQKVPQGFYNIEHMLEKVVRHQG